MEKWRLPEGWEWIKLGNLVTVNYGKGLASRQREGGNIPVYGANGIVGYHNAPLSVENTIIIGRKGSAGAINFSKKTCWPIDTTFFIDSYPEFLEAEYLYNFLRSQPIAELQQSAAIPGLNRDILYGVEVPIPYPNDPARSLAEQRRIVARLEALLGEVREMRGLQSQIAADVGRLMESIVEDNLHDLPQKPLASVVSSYKNGIYKRETFYGRGYPSARMFNIQNGMVNLKEAPLLDVTPEELCQYGLLPGDILVNRVNSRELVGKAGLVLDGTPPCTFESKNIRLRVNRTLADPRFVTFVLNSRMTKVQIQRLQKPAIGQATVNQSDLDSLVIPLPDLAKQIQIAQTLIEARQAISAMIGEQEQTRRYLEQLEQSILAQAFRGEV